MNIKGIIGIVLCSVTAHGLFAADDIVFFKGDGVTRITVNASDIRQMTCKGQDLSASIIGTDGKNIELYITKKAIQEAEIREKEYKPEQAPLNDDRFSIEKKELRVDLSKKNTDGKYLTVFAPKEISVIVTFDNGKLKISNIKGELLLDGKSMDTDLSKISGVVNYRNKSGGLKIDGFEGVLDIKTYSGDIELQNITGSLNAQNTAGDFSLKKFDGMLKTIFQVGDMDISSSKFSGAEIESQSGDIKISDSKGDRISVKVSLGGVSIKNSDIDLISAELSAGELELNRVKADIDLLLKMGDISLKDFSLAGKADSRIKMNFGEISLGFKDPYSYDFFKSKNDEKADYSPGMELTDDFRICTKSKKCLKFETKLGGITVK